MHKQALKVETQLPWEALLICINPFKMADKYLESLISLLLEVRFE